MKPIVIADRWDDSGVPGSSGWAYNGVFDAEKWTDTNGNGRYDPGEPFVDGSSAYTKTKGAGGPINGKYDSEFYDPLSTGYLASTDLGLELTFRLGVPSGVSSSNFFYTADLPIPGSGSTGAARFRWNIANCNPMMVSIGDTLVSENGDMKGPTAQGLQDVMNQDPEAWWNTHAQRVISRYKDASPRLLIIPGFDPRMPLESGKRDIAVTKLFAFFIESSDVNGTVTGRLAWIRKAGGTACGTGGGFIVDCPGSAKSAESDAAALDKVTWGALKATYR